MPSSSSSTNDNDAIKRIVLAANNTDVAPPLGAFAASAVKEKGRGVSDGRREAGVPVTQLAAVVQGRVGVLVAGISMMADLGNGSAVKPERKS
jgi:hypothetical protein